MTPIDTTKSKNNFSIERILSLPSKSEKQKPSPQFIPKAGASIPDQYPPYLANIGRFQTPIAITAPIPPGMLAAAPAISASSNKSVPKVKSKSMTSSSLADQAPLASTSPPSTQTVVKSKNAKKYKCDLCGRGFSRSNTLITHRVSLFFFIDFYLLFDSKWKF